MNLADIIYFKYSEAIKKRQIVLQDDGEGPYIRDWEVSNVEQPTNDQLISWQTESALQLLSREAESLLTEKINETAQSKGYDSVMSIISYVNSSVPQWKAEAETFIAWRDNLFIQAYTILQEIEQGNREILSLEEIKSLIPEIEWPNVE